MLRSNTCTREEQIAAIAAICQQYQITSLEAQEAWLHNQGMTPEQMDSVGLGT